MSILRCWLRKACLRITSISTCAPRAMDMATMGLMRKACHMSAILVAALEIGVNIMNHSEEQIDKLLTSLDVAQMTLR